MLADAMLNNVALKDLLRKKGDARRVPVPDVRSAHEMSDRRAIRVIGADRRVVRYRSTTPADTALRERLSALAEERRRFGYRRLHVLLRGGGAGRQQSPRNTS